MTSLLVATRIFSPLAVEACAAPLQIASGHLVRCFNTSTNQHNAQSSSNTQPAAQGLGFVKKGSAEFRAHMHARQVWRKNVNQILSQWRREIIENRKPANVDQTVAPARVAKAASGMPTEASKGPIDIQQALQKSVKLAQYRVDQARLAVEKARLNEERTQHLQRVKEAQEAAAVEASKTWVTPETLAARIQQALDAPQPFGFTGNIIQHPVFASKDSKASESLEEQGGTPRPFKEGRPVV